MSILILLLTRIFVVSSWTNPCHIPTRPIGVCRKSWSPEGMPLFPLSSVSWSTSSSVSSKLLLTQHRRQRHRRQMIGTGFSFNDGEQILVSVQKPLGLILEQEQCSDKNNADELQSTLTSTSTSSGEIRVADVDPNGTAGRAGVKQGDILMAVQNTATESWDLEDVLQLIGRSPTVVNLRFIRAEQ